jgi:hypothetical protein
LLVGDLQVAVDVGDSTYCLVFGPGAIADFNLVAIPQSHNPSAPLVQVCSKLATVSTRT